MKSLFTSIVIATALIGGATPVMAQDSYVVYNTIYYDTPARDNEVGFLRGGCGRYGPQYTLSGQQTPYSEDFEGGICTNGVLGPI